MVKPQQWLENNYPNKENTTQIYIGDSDNLELNQGELTIANYPNLEGIYATGNGGRKNITKVTIHNCPKLKEVNITNFIDNQQLEIRDGESLEILKCENNQLTSLDLSNFQGLKTLYCNQNKLTELDLTNLEKLDFLSCWGNQLTELDLSQNKLLTEIVCSQNKLAQLTLPNKLDNLQKLWCHENELTSLDFLNSLNPQKLADLSLVNNNFPPQGLEIFASFRELKELRIAGTIKPSNFTGSLKPLKNLNNLEMLNIGGTDISHGLEYLPDSVKEFYCTPYRSEAKVTDIYEELQPFGSDIKKWKEVKMEKKPHLSLASLTPPQLVNEFKKESGFITKVKLIESSLDKVPNYDKLHFNLWNKSNQFLIPKESPTKLYNVSEDKVEETKGIIKEPYAILSYVWGKSHHRDTEKVGLKITSSANKSINKAIKALEVINQELKDQKINYLWVDQLCMDQENQHEKSLEVPKMGKYYDNATLTLINMNAEMGDLSNIDLTDALRKIVNSKWFSRSWCYQEGWLSKHTAFMFDDVLVDGRAMAGTWALNQLSYVEGGKYNSRSEFDRGTKKIATPVGWVYYRGGYDSEKDKVELTLAQALYAIKNRKRTVDLDGVYSILGLLPYGEQVKVRYKIKQCQCADKKNCEHLEIDNASEQALTEVMKVAIKNGYAEPLSWHGESNSKDGLCCLPQLDKNGSTSIMGSVGKVNSTYKDTDSKIYQLITLTDQGLDFAYLIPHYLIHHTNQNIHKIESGFEIEGGLFRKEVVVKPKDKEEEIKVSLLGSQKTLELAERGNVLVVIEKEHYGTNKLFALLVKATGQTNIYHRLGLVELGNSEGIKFILGIQNFKKKTIIGSSNPHQAQIQIPPK